LCQLNSNNLNTNWAYFFLPTDSSTSTLCQLNSNNLNTNWAYFFLPLLQLKISYFIV
jgi:hypothetical protein